MSGKRAFAFDEIDVGRIAKAVRAHESGCSPPSTPFGFDTQQRRYDRLRFRNDYSGTVPAWGVMRVVSVTTVSSEYLYTVNQPDSTYRWLYMVNGPNDVTTGKIGWGTWLFGEGHVLYSGATPSFGEEWGPVASSFYLGQNRPGFYVFGGTTGSGTTARMKAMQIVPAEILVYNATGSAIAAAASGTATLYGGTAGSEASLGLTISAYNRTSVSWANAKYGAVGRLNGKAYVVPFQT